MRPGCAGRTGFFSCIFESERVVTDTNAEQDEAKAGLCAACEHARRTESDRGAVFWRCELSRTDPSFPKYPRLPVLECAGFAARAE